VPDQGSAACWCVVSADGNFLYVATTGTDSIGVFSLADPLHPAQIQELALSHVSGDQNQSGDFQIALDPSGQSLYVVNQSTNPTGTAHRGNQLHVLSVASDGTVSEQSGPIVFSPADVPANAHPQGVAIVSNAGGSSLAVRGGPSSGEALLAFGQVQAIEGSGHLVPITNFIATDLLLAPGATGRLPFAVKDTAGTTDRLPWEIATVNEVGNSAHRRHGQRADISGLEAARLDAFFGSAAGAAIPPVGHSQASL
jgi:Lactonase, 7-bladed beta-propeller